MNFRRRWRKIWRKLLKRISQMKGSTKRAILVFVLGIVLGSFLGNWIGTSTATKKAEEARIAAEKEAAAKLNYFSNNRVTEIDEDVYVGDFYATASGDLMYIKDFDLNEAEGDLYISNTGEGKFVADEVTKIINVYSKAFSDHLESGYGSYFASSSMTTNEKGNFF